MDSPLNLLTWAPVWVVVVERQAAGGRVEVSALVSHDSCYKTKLICDKNIYIKTHVNESTSEVDTIIHIAVQKSVVELRLTN